MPVVNIPMRQAMPFFWKVLFALSAAAWLVVLVSVPGMRWPCRMRFETNDDYWMMAIASGDYTGSPSEFLLYPNVLVGKLLRAAFEIWPRMNAHAVLLGVLHFSFAVVIIRMLLRMKSGALPWVLLCSTAIVFQFPLYLRLQFTTSAFVGALAGILLLLDAPKVRSFFGRSVQLTTGGLLFVLGFLVRRQAAGLAVVLALPAVLASALRKETIARRRELITAALLSLICAVLLEGWDRWYLRQYPEWRAFYAFNRNRGRIHVAPGYAYDARTAPIYDAIGWSSNDVRAFQQWFFPDPNVHGPEDVAYIVRHLRRSVAIKNVLGSWWREIVLSHRFRFAVSGFACLGAMLSGVWAGSIALATGLLSVMLQLFFFATARLPLRILLPLCFAPMLFSLPFWTRGRSDFFQRIMQIMWCVGMILFCAWGIRALVRMNRQHGEMADAWQVARQQETKSGAALLVLWADDWPVEWAPVGFRHQKADPPARYLSLSSLSQSPHQAAVLEAHGITNLVRALIERDDVLLVGREERWPVLQQYLREHHGIRAARTDRGGLFSRRIWKLKRAEEPYE